MNPTDFLESLDFQIIETPDSTEVITGSASRNLHVLEIADGAQGLAHFLGATVSFTVVSQMPVIQNGAHTYYYYRCDSPDKCRQLTSHIRLSGEGGTVTTWPTEGYSILEEPMPSPPLLSWGEHSALIESIMREAMPAPDEDERAAIQEEPPATPTHIQFAPAFLNLEEPPLAYLAEQFLPEGVLMLLHGEPRTRKSWAALDLAIALATGTDAFNLPRFRVPFPVPVLYLSQEDSALLVRLRAKALLRGRQIHEYPNTLAFSVHSGISFDSAAWQDQLFADIRTHGFRFIVFDPIRRFGAHIDKGPAEVQATTAFLRKLATETRVSIGLVHHDVKPPSTGKDERRRAQRASGGDWFAACDCPVAFETAGYHQTLVYPESYKLSSDPEPFTFTLKTDDTRHPRVASILSEITTAEDAGSLAIEEKVFTYLTANPGASANRLATACKTRRDTLSDILSHLEKIGRLDCLIRGRATRWFISKT